MRFDLNVDQQTFATVLGQMLQGAAFAPVEGWGRYDLGTALEAQFDAGGFFDAAAEPDLGPVAAALMVHDVAGVPVCFELAASALIRPFLGRDVPRPLAVRVDGQPGALRYLPQARGIVEIGETVRYADLPDGAAQPVDSLYAYPMGELTDPEALDWQTLDADPAKLRALWQVATAAELTGVLRAGLDAVLAHVRDRRQFGQPLGAFQGVQHRLANAAVEIEGARLMMLRAAQRQAPGDAALALGRAQEITNAITYDLHQFMGAMGLTLEHPLHRWTYRAKLLKAEMGGMGAAYLSYATDRWGAP
ncbi:acyl-CoA dehydrogenase family protein [Mesobacterium pallidum]|uniref:acyl-CoA dehydrogenase family protein n=1 Tax=Mesobacterium pallidum TaxID=2872037 RepID=UPI001EE1E071|nr:acyl-CoA dehydrogenase family protein [Mesobacterium pallidum]